jgi:hypothetical protein
MCAGVLDDKCLLVVGAIQGLPDLPAGLVESLPDLLLGV